MANSADGQAQALQKELDDTNARLKRLEKGDDSANGFIAKDVQSVCLLHVTVGFRNQDSKSAPALRGSESSGRTHPG